MTFFKKNYISTQTSVDIKKQKLCCLPFLRSNFFFEKLYQQKVKGFDVQVQVRFTHISSTLLIPMLVNRFCEFYFINL